MIQNLKIKFKNQSLKKDFIGFHHQIHQILLYFSFFYFRILLFFVYCLFNQQMPNQHRMGHLSMWVNIQLFHFKFSYLWLHLFQTHFEELLCLNQSLFRLDYIMSSILRVSWPRHVLFFFFSKVLLNQKYQKDLSFFPFLYLSSFHHLRDPNIKFYKSLLHL